MLKAALAPLRPRVTCFDGREECLEQLRRGACDVLIVDLDGYAPDGIKLLAEAKRLCPWVTTFALIDQGNVPGAIQAMKAGAADCLERPLTEEGLRCAIGPVLARTREKAPGPDVALTRMETKVLNLVSTGQTSDQIATMLHRSRRTVDVHRGHIMRKLGVSGTMDLIKEAARRGLIRLDGSEPARPIGKTPEPTRKPKTRKGRS
jgi:FixJ family two-component response regulator